MTLSSAAIPLATQPRTALLCAVCACAALAGVSSVLFLASPLEAAVSVLFALVMLAIVWSDLQRFIIPDTLSLPMIPAGLYVSWLFSGPWAVETVQTNLAAALFGYGAFWLIRWGYKVYAGRTGLGLGDVKLAAAAGAWTGFEGLVNVWLLASFAAIGCVLAVKVFSGANISAGTKIAFGAFLAPAIWIVWFAQQAAGS